MNEAAGSARQPDRHRPDLHARPHSLAAFGCAVRRFIREELGEGTISFDGLSWTTRLLILTGFALLGAAIFALIANELLRTLIPPLTVPPSSSSIAPPPIGRGAVLPVVLMPATLLLLSISWSFILAGGLHARPIVRLGTLFLYLITTLAWLGYNKPNLYVVSEEWTFANFYGPWLLWALLLAVPIFFAVRWRAQVWPMFEFTVLLVMVSATLAVAQACETVSQRADDAPFVLPSVPETIGTLQTFGLLLLFFVGLSILEFAYRVSRFAAIRASNRPQRWVPAAALTLILGVCLFTGARETVEAFDDAGSLGAGLVEYVGALGIPLAVVLVWWFTMGRRGTRTADTPAVERMFEVGKTAVVPLVVILFVLYFAPNIFFMFTRALIAVPGERMAEISEEIFLAVQNFFNAYGEQYSFGGRYFLAGLTLALAFWLARRGSRYLALYLGVFGAVDLWSRLTDSGQLLEYLEWVGPEHMYIQEFVYGGGRDPVSLWFVLILALTGLLWLVRGRLTAERVRRLLFLLLLVLLIQQTELIEDPFSPISGLAGVGFLIAIGVTWDLLTAGSWANVGSVALPRLSRVFLYVGYVLFSVTVIGWSISTHNFNEADFLTSGAAIHTLLVFGKPLVYAIIAVALMLPATGEEATPATATPPEGGPTSFAQEPGAWAQIKDFGLKRVAGLAVAVGVIVFLAVGLFDVGESRQRSAPETGDDLPGVVEQKR